jgi:hypothetical protein
MPSRNNSARRLIGFFPEHDLKKADTNLPRDERDEFRLKQEGRAE